MNWAELAQEFPVPKCDSARSVNLDRVLVVLTYLNDTARLAGRFLLNFHWGGNVLKGHSKWLKRAAYALLMIIYITLRNV